MKKIVLGLIVGILLAGFIGLVVAEQGNSDSEIQGNAVLAGNSAGNSGNKDEVAGAGLNLRDKLKIGVEKEVENQIGNRIKLKLMKNNKIRLRARNVSADCDCELIQEQVQNKTKLKVKLKNGRNAEIKIMPNVASETALQRLRLKVCNESNNCSIELKEVALKRKAGNETNATRLAYEMQIQRHSKLIWLFRKKMQIKTEIDAETGEIISVKKPWWAFLARESEEE